MIFSIIMEIFSLYFQIFYEFYTGVSMVLPTKLVNVNLQVYKVQKSENVVWVTCLTEMQSFCKKY